MRIFNNLLTDKEKVNLIVNKYIYFHKYKLRFNEQRYVNSSNKNNWYFNCLTNVKIFINFELPINTTHLYYDHRGPIDFVLPNTITHLNFGYLFNHNIQKYHPLEELGKYKYHNFVNSYIPDSVIYLEFGKCFNKSIYGCIPNSVKYLKIDSFYFEFAINDLPESIISLHIRSSKCQIYDSLKLPKSLQNLVVHVKFKNLIKDMISENVKVKYID